jgi:peptidoglycan/xylan/chitin deacetylase (PgdA/CDA1 family)
MKVSATVFVAFTCGALLAASGCGGGSDAASETASGSPAAVERTPIPAPEVTLTPEDESVWAPLPPDRSRIPVLLYHGIAPAEDFANTADAEYGIDPEDFAKQMTMIAHAGYETIDLDTFLRFVAGEQVDLPPRPLLLTFDDARADSWTGGDDILRELGFNAVMFVDVGRVDGGDPEYLTWDELAEIEESDRWELQLHAGEGHQQVQYGPDPDDVGPYYAYELEGEDFEDWRERVRSDIEWGRDTLAEHVPGYAPRAFALPYGNYGQDGTNDPRIPDDLLGWLTDEFDAVFVQDVNALARAGEQPLGRIQVTRGVTGGDLHERLLTGEQ